MFQALSLVAVMSSENVFYTPLHKREDAFKVKQKFISPLGDHITLLNVYKAFCKAPFKKVTIKINLRFCVYFYCWFNNNCIFFLLQQWCKENFLNHKNLSYAFEVRSQLLSVCQRLNLPVTSCGTVMDQVKKKIFSI